MNKTKQATPLLTLPYKKGVLSAMNLALSPFRQLELLVRHNGGDL